MFGSLTVFDAIDPLLKSMMTFSLWGNSFPRWDHVRFLRSGCPTPFRCSKTSFSFFGATPFAPGSPGLHLSYTLSPLCLCWSILSILPGDPCIFLFPTGEPNRAKVDPPPVMHPGPVFLAGPVPRLQDPGNPTVTSPQTLIPLSRGDILASLPGLVLRNAKI